MKKLLTLLFVCTCTCLHAQIWPGWNFDNVITFDSGGVPYQSLIKIDTSLHRNNWQIGAPHKSSFAAAYSPHNVIITDTAAPYAASDTSVFFLKVPRNVPHFSNGVFGVFLYTTFKYRLMIDSGTKVSVDWSLDSGSNWKAITDSLPDYLHLSPAAPNFSATSDTSWQTLTISSVWPLTSDTLFLRFSLIADSTPTTKGGWMIDNIDLSYYWEGAVHSIQNPNLISLYPNPSHGNLFIHSDKPNKDATITIYNTLGQQVYSRAARDNDHLSLSLPNGLYTLRYSTDEEYCVKQIVIQK